jgi:hypothetical protein
MIWRKLSNFRMIVLIVNILHKKTLISDFCVISQRLTSTLSLTGATLKSRELKTFLSKVSVGAKLHGVRAGGGSPPQVVVHTNAGRYRVVEHLVSHALEILDREMQRFRIP